MKTGMHNHQFVEDYDGLIGFGFDRDTDEKSLMVYLQKFSDDDLLRTLVPRLNDDELQEIFQLISRLIRKHLKDAEYHQLFLKDEEG